ncbi:MAG: hypothetical protein IJU23_08645 [Proteobacteria bacterium]|nr:hypothetical protein [Pseudomonadota bacterium]
MSKTYQKRFPLGQRCSAAGLFSFLASLPCPLSKGEGEKKLGKSPFPGVTRYNLSPFQGDLSSFIEGSSYYATHVKQSLSLLLSRIARRHKCKPYAP